MTEKKKVGIMGGTFDPIHVGHLILAENARVCLELDEILFIPSGTPYMKENVLDSRTRIAMTSAAIEDNPYFALSKIEAERSGRTYTYETLQQLKQDNPNTEYYFIVGADSLFSMDGWKNPEAIFSSCIIIAAMREGHSRIELCQQIEYLKERYYADVRLLPERNVDISSTDIRDRVRNHESIRYLVHDSVLDYIEKHHIYQEIEADNGVNQ